MTAFELFLDIKVFQLKLCTLFLYIKNLYNRLHCKFIITSICFGKPKTHVTLFTVRFSCSLELGLEHLEGIPVVYNMPSLLTAHYRGHLQMRSVKVLFRECHSLLLIAMVNVRTKNNLVRKEFISCYS